jgi:Flp pilus assembly protein TadD
MPLALALFAVTLLPVLHLVPLWADMADRFALVPSIAVALIVAAGLSRVADKWRRVALVGWAAALAVYASATVIDTRAWASDATLWRYAVDRQPEASLGHANLIIVHIKEGRWAEALAESDKAMALGRRDDEVMLWRGIALWGLGRKLEAEATVTRALEMKPERPLGHALYGKILLERDDVAGATRELAQAMKYGPDLELTKVLAKALAERTQGPIR